jgi:hypothetical protein
MQKMLKNVSIMSISWKEKNGRRCVIGGDMSVYAGELDLFSLFGD